MALVEPQPKVRSRKGGAAVPLDATDKLLLNLLQSSFPLEREPFGVISRMIRSSSKRWARAWTSSTGSSACRAMAWNGSRSSGKLDWSRFNRSLSAASSGTAAPAVRERALGRGLRSGALAPLKAKPWPLWRSR